jgi:riboflavin synthase
MWKGPCGWQIDQVCRLISLNKDMEFMRMGFMGIDETARENIIKKGSIAVNGVSLTINDVMMQGADYGFEVMLIPQTLKETNLSELTVGDKVNIEFDMIVKIVNNQKNQMNNNL